MCLILIHLKLHVASVYCIRSAALWQGVYISNQYVRSIQCQDRNSHYSHNSHHNGSQTWGSGDMTMLFLSEVWYWDGRMAGGLKELDKHSSSCLNLCNMRLTTIMSMTTLFPPPSIIFTVPPSLFFVSPDSWLPPDEPQTSVFGPHVDDNPENRCFSEKRIEILLS